MVEPLRSHAERLFSVPSNAPAEAAMLAVLWDNGMVTERQLTRIDERVGEHWSEEEGRAYRSLMGMLDIQGRLTPAQADRFSQRSEAEANAQLAFTSKVRAVADQGFGQRTAGLVMGVLGSLAAGRVFGQESVFYIGAGSTIFGYVFGSLRSAAATTILKKWGVNEHEVEISAISALIDGRNTRAAEAAMRSDRALNAIERTRTRLMMHLPPI